MFSEGSAFVALKAKQRLECFERLQSSLEADFSGLQAMLLCCLRHDGSNEVVGQDVCPDFLANEFRCLAAQDVHLKGDFDIPNIEFLTPSTAIQARQLFLSRCFRIEQCCDNDDFLRAETFLRDANTCLSNLDVVRQSLVSGCIHSSKWTRLIPSNHVVAFSQTLATSKVGAPRCLVESADAVDATLFERQHFVPG